MYGSPAANQIFITKSQKNNNNKMSVADSCGIVKTREGSGGTGANGSILRGKTTSQFTQPREQSQEVAVLLYSW